jgi:hypothetical protein
MSKKHIDPHDDPEAVRMRLLRHAEGYGEDRARWAAYLGLTYQAVSNYEIGQRRVPRDVALTLYQKIPGFNPIWLWTGEEQHLAFDLRQRIRAAQVEAVARAERAERISRR